jgi:hypothetical protein
MVRLDMVERAARHARNRGIRRILDHGQAAASLDRPEPGRAVAERTRQHHADDPSAERGRCRAEERVDFGARQVLARASPQQDVAVMQQQMETGTAT